VRQAREVRVVLEAMTDSIVEAGDAMEPVAGGALLPARALLVGESLNTQRIERAKLIATQPLTMRVGEGGYGVFYRFGVIVLFGVPPIGEAALLASIEPFVVNPRDTTAPEDVDLLVGAQAEDTVRADGVICIRQVTTEHLQVVADVLAKSMVLEHYERQLACVFDQFQPLADTLRRTGRSGRNTNQLLRQIGDLMLTQHHMVGRVEIAEKPDLLWDHPELERLHSRLAAEFELLDRDRALSRKMRLISDTAEALLNLVHNKRSLRVEWYIVILILVEIVLSLYELFFRH
jgi:uncharacterized Rmd1/YagE family protein